MRIFSAYASVSAVDDKALAITGTIVDSVSMVGDATLGDSDMWTFVNSLNALLKSMVSYPTGEPLEEVKVLLPIGNASRPHLEKAQEIRVAANGQETHVQGSKYGANFEWVKTISTFTSLQALLDFLRQPADVRANMWKYWQTISAFSVRLSHPRFFTTGRGYAGLAPPGVQPGDSVALFHGASVPFIIRPHTSVKGMCRLVGETYVHGIMHGEALEFSDLAEETIYLV